MDGFIAPEADRQRAASLTGGFIAPDADQKRAKGLTGFVASPADQQRAHDFSLLEKPAEDLAKDYGFHPEQFYLTHSDRVTPDQLEKLIQISSTRATSGLTPGAVGEAAKNTPGAVKEMAGGVLAAAKSGTPAEIAKEFLLQTGRGKSALDAALGTAKKLGGEALAGVETTAQNMGSLVRSGVRQEVNNPVSRALAGGVAKIVGPTLGLQPEDLSAPKVQADIYNPADFFKPENARQRFFDRVGQLQQTQKVATGEGQYAKAAGLDADTLAKEGITLDPEVISGFSIAADPTTWVPFLSGLKVVRIGTGALEILNGAGQRVATAATQGAAEKFINRAASLVRSGVEKTANVVEAGASKLDAGVAKAVTPERVGYALALEALTHSAGVPGMAATAAAKGGARLGLNAVKGLAKLAGSDTALDLTETATRGAGHGALYSLPFAAAQEDPEQQAATVFTGGALGALGAGTAHTFSKVAPRAAQLAISTLWQEGTLQPTPDVSFNIAGLESLEAEHQAHSAALRRDDPQAANLINRLRAAAAPAAPGADGKPPVTGIPRRPIYLVSSETAERINPEMKDKEGVNRIAVQGSDGKPHDVVLIVNPEATTHEFGHLLTDPATGILRSEERKQILDATPDELLSQFRTSYLSRELTPAQKARASSPRYIENEYLAELFGKALSGDRMDKVPPTLRQKLYQGLGTALEDLGIAAPEIAPGEKGATPGMGLRNTFNAEALANKVLDRWLADPEVSKAINEAGKPPVIGSESAQATEPVKLTPGQGKIFDALTQRVPEMSELRQKLEKGEPLSADEAQIWSQVQDLAKDETPEPRVVESPTDEFDIQPAPKAPGQQELPIRPVTPPPAEEIPVKPAAPAPAEPRNLRGIGTKDYHPFMGPGRSPEEIGLTETAKAVEASADLTPEQKTAFATLADNTRKPVQITYRSAATEGDMNRSTRREEIEAGRNGGARIEEGVGKVAIPLAYRVTKEGKAQINVFSPDKALANAKQLVAETLKSNTARFRDKLIPYENRDGSLTPAGEEQFNADLEAYLANQDNGYRGDGEKIVRPEGYKGFVPGENPDYTPVKLPKARAQFLNLVQGVNPPKSAREVSVQGVKKYPTNLRAQDFNRVQQPPNDVVRPTLFKNKKGEVPVQAYESFGGREIAELNTLRKRFDEAGVNTRELTETTEWINAHDILDVKPQPENRLRPAVTDLVNAGFMPKGNSEDPIVAAAVRHEGKVYTGPFHSAIQAANPHLEGFGEDGFVTRSGKFLDRAEAFQTAKKNDQVFPDNIDDGELDAGAFEPADGEPKYETRDAQFLPARERKEIEVTGPDGKKYRATFDGYQDMRVIGRGMQPQITALEDIPGVTGKHSTTYGSSLEGKGYKLPQLEEPAQFMPAVTEAGKKLEKQGLHILRYDNPRIGSSMWEIRDPEYKSVAFLEVVREDDGKTANVSMTSTEKEHRGKGYAETLYREMLTTLSGEGVQQLTGHVIHRAPIAIRSKLLGDPEVRNVTEYPNGETTLDVSNDIPEGAQFLPEEKERIASAANRHTSGKIGEGSHHADAMEHLIRQRVFPGIKSLEDLETLPDAKRNRIWDSVEQGFVTDKGRFLSREEAAKLAGRELHGEDLSQFLPAKFWLESDGKVTRVERKHEDVEQRVAKGALRANVQDDTLFLDGRKESFSDLPRTQRESVEDLALERGLALSYNGEFIDDFGGAAFMPVSTKTEQRGGNEEVRSIAEDYLRKAGLKSEPHTGNVKVNEALAVKIADAFESATHRPSDPEVKASYDRFAQETVDQWKAITAAGVKMEPWSREGQPYRNSAEMMADIRDNKHLWFFPSEEGFGTGEPDAAHPLLKSSGLKVDGHDLPVNDVFRAVHDFFGHAKEGYEFGPRGELNAFLTHARMYSDEARPAMAAETLGQNSWVNFGRHLRDAEGAVPKRGEPGYVPLTERPFADQKATLLPPELVDAALAGEEGAQYMPTLAELEKKWAKHKAQKKKQKTSPLAKKNLTSWMLPDGELAEATGNPDFFHDQDLITNRERYREDFGLPAKKQPTRMDAINTGFVRLRYWPNRGEMSVEASPATWSKMKSKILPLLLAQADKIDDLRVNLLTPRGKALETFEDQIFRAPERETAIEELVKSVKPPMTERNESVGPSMIQRARALPDPEQFLPAAQIDLFGESKKPVTDDVRQMSPVALRKAFPEAVVPNDRSRVTYDFESAPLLKGLKTEEQKIAKYADVLAEEASKFEGLPEFKSGLQWYSEFVPKLKKWFGKNSDLFAELLAATSPRTNPGVNFQYATKAFEGWLRGEYDQQVAKYNEGFEMSQDNRLKEWFEKTVPKDQQPENATTPHHMAAWIAKHDLVPTQWGRFTQFGDAREVKFGMHGERILRVLARKWLTTNQGLKVNQFVRNLKGTDHGATVDVWAARTMRRLGYDVGEGKRWRILPEMEAGVTDPDFLFAQKVFSQAADKLGVTADALQGGMWFAEKKYWADHGWQRLDLGDFRTELEDFVAERKLRKAQGSLFDEPIPINKVGGRIDADIRPVSKRTLDLFDIKPKS